MGRESKYGSAISARHQFILLTECKLLSLLPDHPGPGTVSWYSP